MELREGEPVAEIDELALRRLHKRLDEELERMAAYVLTPEFNGFLTFDEVRAIQGPIRYEHLGDRDICLSPREIRELRGFSYHLREIDDVVDVDEDSVRDWKEHHRYFVSSTEIG